MASSPELSGPTAPRNDALTPLSQQHRVFGWQQHASLWFSLGVGLLVMQIGAYLVPAVGTQAALAAVVLGSLVGAGLLAFTARLGPRRADAGHLWPRPCPAAGAAEHRPAGRLDHWAQPCRHWRLPSAWRGSRGRAAARGQPLWRRCQQQPHRFRCKAVVERTMTAAAAGSGNAQAARVARGGQRSGGVRSHWKIISASAPRAETR